MSDGALTTTNDMIMVHDLFRRESGLLPDMVRAVPSGDLARVQVVADHTALISELLQHHHEVEDDFVWALLLERCSGPISSLVQIMEDQHGAIASIGAEVRPALARWRVSGSAGERDELADELDMLLPPLREHLSLEEKEVVPFIERHISVDEWNNVQQKAMGGLAQELVPLTFGMLFYEGAPQMIDAVLANLPAEHREPMRQQSAQAFTEHSQRVHGTPTPRRSTELEQRSRRQSTTTPEEAAR